MAGVKVEDLAELSHVEALEDWLNEPDKATTDAEQALLNYLTGA